MAERLDGVALREFRVRPIPDALERTPRMPMEMHHYPGFRSPSGWRFGKRRSCGAGSGQRCSVGRPKASGAAGGSTAVRRQFCAPVAAGGSEGIERVRRAGVLKLRFSVFSALRTRLYAWREGILGRWPCLYR